MEEEKKKRNGALIVCIILLILSLGVGGFFAYKYFKNENEKKEEEIKEKQEKEVQEKVEETLKKSKQSSMRTSAEQIISAVLAQLQTNYEISPGKYAFSKNILETGGIDAPFGGKYAYYEPQESDKVIGSGVYRISEQSNADFEGCQLSSHSYLTIARDSDNQYYIYTICLTTSNSGEDGGSLFATRDQLSDENDTSIFYGKAK